MPVAAREDVAQLAGPVLIGYLLHWGLFGALTVQLYLYYEAFPRDRLSIKCLVYIVYAIEFVQTMLLTYDSFSSFGYGFGDLGTVTDVQFDWLCIPIMGGIIAFMVHSFYAHRIYIFSESVLISGLIVLISLGSMMAGFITGGLAQKTSDLTKLHRRDNYTAVAAWIGGSALCDVIIAGCLTYHLSKHDTEFRRTHLLILKLIRITIVTGTLTAMVALTNLSLFLIPNQTYFPSAGPVQTKLYANTMYAVLISRLRIAGGRGGAYSTEADAGGDYLSSPEFRDHPVAQVGGASHRGCGSRAIFTTMRSASSPVITVSREVFADRELDELVKGKRLDIRTSTDTDNTSIMIAHPV